MAHIVLCVDGGYAVPGAVVVSSLVRNLDPDTPVMLWMIHDGLSPGQQAFYRAAVASRGNETLEFLEIPKSLLSLPSKSDYISTVTYGRFAIPRLLPESVSKVLYLDADLLIRGDISPLLNVDLLGHSAAAVREPSDPLFGSLRGLQHTYDLDLNPLHPYFNAGVLLLDLGQLRERDIERLCVDYVSRHEPDRMDQDALNAALCGHILELSPRWNLEDYYFESEERRTRYRSVIESASIIHFVGHNKPWNDGSLWLVEEWQREHQSVRGALGTR